MRIESEAEYKYEPDYSPPAQNCQPRKILKGDCQFLIVGGDLDRPANTTFSCAHPEEKSNVRGGHCRYFSAEN